MNHTELYHLLRKPGSARYSEFIDMSEQNIYLMNRLQRPMNCISIISNTLYFHLEDYSVSNKK